jgi:hypothetical protein
MLPIRFGGMNSVTLILLCSLALADSPIAKHVA